MLFSGSWDASFCLCSDADGVQQQTAAVSSSGPSGMHCLNNQNHAHCNAVLILYFYRAKFEVLWTESEFVLEGKCEPPLMIFWGDFVALQERASPWPSPSSPDRRRWPPTTEPSRSPWTDRGNRAVSAHTPMAVAACGDALKACVRAKRTAWVIQQVIIEASARVWACTVKIVHTVTCSGEGKKIKISGDSSVCGGEDLEMRMKFGSDVGCTGYSSLFSPACTRACVWARALEEQGKALSQETVKLIKA